MENKHLIDKERIFAIPFWYNNKSNTLCFEYYTDESLVPKKYRGNIISIETRLYVFTIDDGEKKIIKDVTIKFKDKWNPSLITPKKQCYKNNVVDGIIPELNFSILYRNSECINNPGKIMKDVRCSNCLVDVKLNYFYRYDDECVDSEEEKEEENFYLSPNEDFDYLEFSVCYLAVLSQLSNSKTFFHYTDLAKLMTEYVCFLSGVGFYSELLSAIQGYILNFNYFPQKYQDNIIRNLRRNSNVMNDTLEDINRFLYVCG